MNGEKMATLTTRAFSHYVPHWVARVGMIAFSALAAGIVGVVGLLLFWSYPGRPKPFEDENGTLLPGSLAEKIFIDVNGVKQGLIIESRDTSNPVLLYLHGGLPDYLLSVQSSSPTSTCSSGSARWEISTWCASWSPHP
jgi:hypothetical protein